MGNRSTVGSALRRDNNRTRCGLLPPWWNPVQDPLGLAAEPAFACGPRRDQEEGPVRRDLDCMDAALVDLGHHGSRRGTAERPDHRVQGTPHRRGHDADDLLRNGVPRPRGDQDARGLEQERSLEGGIDWRRGEEVMKIPVVPTARTYPSRNPPWKWP